MSEQKRKRDDEVSPLENKQPKVDIFSFMKAKQKDHIWSIEDFSLKILNQQTHPKFKVYTGPDVRELHSDTWETTNRKPSVYFNLPNNIEGYYNKMHDINHISYQVSKNFDKRKSVLNWVQSDYRIRIYVIYNKRTLDMGLFKGVLSPKNANIIRFTRAT
jgi:hypothetical protein